MSVDQTDTIDMINQSRTTGALHLVISDHLPWDDIGAHVAILQRKIERYLLFIKTREILRLHPRAASHPKVIQVFFLMPPPKGAAEYFLKEMDRLVTLAGVGFAYDVFDGPI